MRTMLLAGVAALGWSSVAQADLLLAAGGGGGGTGGQGGGDAQVGTSGTGYDGYGVGGSNGSGGSAGGSSPIAGGGGGGAGIAGAGGAATGTDGGMGGASSPTFAGGSGGLAGGAGGSGGFGGGGGGGSNFTFYAGGGGGGGYSGGNGGLASAQAQYGGYNSATAGGGGGSYLASSFSNPVLTGAAQSGAGFVSIALGTNAAVNFGYTGAPIFYVLPGDGTYHLSGAGAQGGDGYNIGGIQNGPRAGGRGAMVSGDVQLDAGDLLEIIVGGQGQVTGQGGSGGGGGSFVFDLGLQPTSMVPEPTTLALLGTGMLGLGLTRRKRAS